MLVLVQFVSFLNTLHCHLVFDFILHMLVKPNLSFYFNSYSLIHIVKIIRHGANAKKHFT